MAAGDISLDLSGLPGARFSGHVINGQECGPWVSEFEFDAEDEVIEWNGQGGQPTVRIPDGYTYTATATVANHPTIMGILEPLYYTRTAGAKTPFTWAWTTADGRTLNLNCTITHLTYSSSSGDLLTVDVEMSVHGIGQLG